MKIKLIRVYFFLHLSPCLKSQLIRNNSAILTSRTMCGEKKRKRKKRKRNNYSLAHFPPGSPSPRVPSFSSPLFRKHEALELRASRVSVVKFAGGETLRSNQGTALFARVTPFCLAAAPTPSLSPPPHPVFASNNTSVPVFLPPSRVNTQTRATLCDPEERFRLHAEPDELSRL